MPNLWHCAPGGVITLVVFVLSSVALAYFRNIYAVLAWLALMLFCVTFGPIVDRWWGRG